MIDPFIKDHSLEDELLRSLKDLRHINTALAFSSIDSTNAHAMRLATKGAKSGTAVISSVQTAGRGRLQRRWLSGMGDIALSLLLMAESLPQNLAILPMLAATAVRRALLQIGVDAKLKWPNDIVVLPKATHPLPYCKNFRKLGGILVETLHGAKIASIIGIGLNLNHSDELLLEVPHAIGLRALLGDIDRAALIINVLKLLDKGLSSSDSPGQEKAIMSEYRSHCQTIGHEVEVEIGDKVIRGCAIDVNADGSLVIDDGSDMHKVYAGDLVYL